MGLTLRLNPCGKGTGYIETLQCQDLPDAPGSARSYIQWKSVLNASVDVDVVCSRRMCGNFGLTPGESISTE